MRPADVDLDALRRVLLHHRHVLARGRVEDDRGRGRRDQAADHRPARDVGEVDRELAGAAPVQAPELELALDHVERALGAVDEDQLLGREGEDLAGELGPDRAAGAGDHHDLVADRRRRRPGRGR